VADEPADEQRDDRAAERDRDEQREALILERGRMPVDRFDVLASALRQSIDADLERLPVGAVGIGVALRVGCRGRDLGAAF